MAANQVLALVDDLFFRTRISAVASLVGVPVSFRSLPKGDNSSGIPNLALVDLTGQRFDPFEEIRSLKSQPGVTVVGFYPHIRTDLETSAREAGCDYVIRRSVFTKRLPEILKGEFDAINRGGP